MADILTLHPEPEHAVKLTGAEWVAIMLKLAGRNRYAKIAEAAEAKMIRQFEGAK